jgi:hypothetical protein
MAESGKPEGVGIATLGQLGTDQETDPSRITDLLRSELDSYMEYQMGLHKLKELFQNDLKILEINGPWLEFTRLPASGSSLPDYFGGLATEGLPVDSALIHALEARGISNLYRHQEDAIRAALSGHSILLPHPTGSGKTEAFFVPILQHLLQEIRGNQRYGLGCLMIFPTKALENDQRDRLKELLYSLESELGTKIPFIGVYDGDTPSQADFVKSPHNTRLARLRQYTERCPKCKRETLRYNMGGTAHLLRCDEGEDIPGRPGGCGYPEEFDAGIPWIRTTREDMQNSDKIPNLVITNPEALDFRLLEPAGKGIFKTQMGKVIVVIDEAHAYSATGALGLRFLMSRLEEKIRQVNGNDVQFQYVVSSATLDDPAEFAKRLLPWVDFTLIQFTPSEHPFRTPGAKSWSLDCSLAGFDPDDADWLFEILGEELEGAKALLKGRGLDPARIAELLKTAESLNLVRVETGKIHPGSIAVQSAWSAFESGKPPQTVEEFLRVHLKARLQELDNAVELYAFSDGKPRDLPQILTWWASKWPDRASTSRSDVLDLVRIGRRLGLWEERWHAFIRAPRGIGGCSGPTLHAIRVSAEEPLPATCTSCTIPGPVFEICTCTDCGEVYFSLYRCPSCASLTARPEPICGHGELPEELLVRRQDAIDKRDLEQLRDSLFDAEDEEEPGCRICEGDILPVRRRTDQIVEMAVSLTGWSVPERRRKFLLFTDGRAAAERISREFNNQEEKIWAERVLMSVLLRDPNRGPHEARGLSEVRRKVFLHLYKPYRDALRGVVRQFELDIITSTLTTSAYQALGRSFTSGSSRLFEHGLMAYAFDEFEETIRTLGLEKVVPRVCDILRTRSSPDKGLRKDRLVRHFLNGPENYAAAIKAEVGPDNEKLERALELLRDRRWVSEVVRPSETRYFFNPGESTPETDPYLTPMDMRKVRVPDQVWFCPQCGRISWYLSQLCDQCGATMTKVSHTDLLIADYFAGILCREPRPIVAAVHRSGLDPVERRLLEARFRADLNSIHFLSATPTLELGIDVGQLSFILLSRVPPTKSSYIQRVGRAGRRRREGAACLTFAYPTPLDAYYFRHPESLLQMKAGRIPVQQLATEHLDAFLWSSLLDAFALKPPARGGKLLDYTTSAREILEGTGAYSIPDFASDIQAVWRDSARGWSERVLDRCVIEGWDRISREQIASHLTDFGAKLQDELQVSQHLLRLESFKVQQSEVDRLHASLSDRIAGLRNKKRTKDDEIELAKLETRDKNLQEYKKHQMLSAPLLLYLHSLGTVSSARGLTGSSVTVHDIEAPDTVIEDRDAKMAISELFPGGYISRQGLIYEISEMVYDPIRRPHIRVCPRCNAWLAEPDAVCDIHPTESPTDLPLETPIVGFGHVTRFRVRESRGNRRKAIKPRRSDIETTSRILGTLQLETSQVEDLKIASFCHTWDIFDRGRRVRPDLPIMICGSCNSAQHKGVKCCTNPSPRQVTQGEVYGTRGCLFRITSPESFDAFRESPPPLGPLVPPIVRYVAQSLSNALLNSFALNLNVEPSMLDSTLQGDSAFWIFEPTSGGYGILDQVLRSPEQMAEVFDGVRDIIETRVGEHECSRFCDQCLIVPRYSNSELKWLHRPLLERALGS